VKFTFKSASERILKINQHLVNLEPKYNGTVFLDTVYELYDVLY